MSGVDGSRVDSYASCKRCHSALDQRCSQTSFDPRGSPHDPLRPAVPGPPTRRRLVAPGGGLPGLPAQLRRQQRRRDRRHRRRHLPDRLPGRSRRRRGLAEPVLPVGAGRRGLRRRRLPRRGTRAGHPRRLRRDGRRRARGRHQGDRRHRAEPHLGPAPVVRRGAGVRAGLDRPRPLHLPRRARGRRRTATERLDQPLRRPGLDPAAGWAVVPATCSRPSSRI